MTSDSTRDSERNDEPREGIVLPSNGEAWDPLAQRRSDAGSPGAGVPSTGQPWGEPWGPEQRQPPPPQQLSPPRSSPDEASTELIPQVTDPGGQGGPGGQGEGDVESTTQLRALPLHTTPPRPERAPVDSEGATQLIPPVVDDGPAPGLGLGPGPGSGAAEQTTQLRAVRPRRRHAAPSPSPSPAPPRAGGMDETRSLPPIPAASPRRQAPGPVPGPMTGQFTGQFRSGGRPAPPPPGGGGGRWPGGLVVALVLGGAVVIGLAAGALLSSGGSDSDASADSAATAGTGTGTEDQEGSEGEDSGGTAAEDGNGNGNDEDSEARQQAEDLSDLLEDSNDSREAVIQAVQDIGSCKRLDQAAEDLRAAASERTNLVERLDELSLDALADGDELASALTEAWEASAEADEYYAAWAEDLAGDRKKLCKGGQASRTGNASEADGASGDATQAKERAADLWNPVAREYGLPERAASEL